MVTPAGRDRHSVGVCAGSCFLTCSASGFNRRRTKSPGESGRRSALACRGATGVDCAGSGRSLWSRIEAATEGGCTPPGSEASPGKSLKQPSVINLGSAAASSAATAVVGWRWWCRAGASLPRWRLRPRMLPPRRHSAAKVARQLITGQAPMPSSAQGALSSRPSGRHRSCQSFVIATRDHVRSGSNVVIAAAMRAVSGPRSFGTHRHPGRR